MRGSVVHRSHVSPPSSDRNRPARRLTNRRRPDVPAAMAIACRPAPLAGSPLAGTCVHVLPWSADLYIRMPVPPPCPDPRPEAVGESVAYSARGLSIAATIDAEPPASSLKRTFRHARPPSTDLNTPRSAPEARSPIAAARTMSGLAGSTMISPITCVSARPTLVHVAPASVDL